MGGLRELQWRVRDALYGLGGCGGGWKAALDGEVVERRGEALAEGETVRDVSVRAMGDLL